MIGQAAINAARHMGIEHPNCSGCSALSEELITWQKDYDSMCRMLSEPAAADLLWALKRIIGDLPSNRDWLDPVIEGYAKEAIAKAEVYVERRK